MPICFGVLNMTADEIYDSTPFDINNRIKGYEERQRIKRMLIASFFTLPIINSGFNRPKKTLKLQDIIPDDLMDDNVLKAEIDEWREILKNAER